VSTPGALRALVAVGKHARAISASVVLAFDENVATLVVTDDGIGFDPERAVGFGRGQLRSRATQVGGQAEISSRTGGGTTVRVTIPLVALLRPLVPFRSGSRRTSSGPGVVDFISRGGRAMMLRLLLVDDHPVVRAGLRGMLAGEPDLEVVGKPPTAKKPCGSLPNSSRRRAHGLAPGIDGRRPRVASPRSTRRPLSWC